jgi:hypothetical protein
MRLRDDQGEKNEFSATKPSESCPKVRQKEHRVPDSGSGNLFEEKSHGPRSYLNIVRCGGVNARDASLHWKRL